jgi:hypothetical protein
MQTLKCSSCNEEKDLTHFHKKSTARGWDYNCKECKNSKYLTTREMDPRFIQCQECEFFRSIKNGNICTVCLRKNKVKICPKCLLTKSLTEFYKNAANNSQCKECLSNSRVGRENRCQICRSSRLTANKDCLECLNKKGYAWCKHCNSVLPLSEFYIRGSMSCKDCAIYLNLMRNQVVKYTPVTAQENRKRGIKHKYNLTEEIYDQMVLRQNGKCAICFNYPKSSYPKLYIDHDHKTGKLRGLLCHTCNSGVGMLKDDKTILQSAINYLDSYAALDSSLGADLASGVDSLIASGAES